MASARPGCRIEWSCEAPHSVVSEMATDVDILNAARELLDRHGERAVEVAKEHAEMLLKSGDQHAHDIALRVLTEIERMLE